MSFLGKSYELVRQENYEGFINSLTEVAEEDRQKLTNLKVTIKLEKKGDEYVMTSTIPSGASSAITFKDGEEFDESIKEHKAKSKITVSGNTVLHTQKFHDHVLTFKREYNGDEMVSTITNDKWPGGVAKRFYKAV